MCPMQNFQNKLETKFTACQSTIKEFDKKKYAWGKCLQISISFLNISLGFFQ